MLIDRHQQINLFESIVPGAMMHMDPELQRIDTLLDDDEVFSSVKADLAKRFPHTTCRGRPSTPVEVILRMLIVKHLYNWSYEETERLVNDSLSLRHFCRIYLETVPDDTVLIRWAQLISERTLQHLHEHLVVQAKRHKLTRGRKLRIDTTVVETNIHHPTDSTLLQDGVRILARAMNKVKQLGLAPQALTRDFTRSVKRRVVNILKFSKSRSEKGKTAFKRSYQELCDITRRAVTLATRVESILQNNGSDAAQTIGQRLTTVLPQIEGVIDQTRRRVVRGERVPAEEKLLSLHEPTTSIHRRGKRTKDAEFGHLLKLQMTEGDIISDVEVIPTPCNDTTLLKGSLKKHMAFFGRAPTHLAADRGFFSGDNERSAYEQGVSYVALPAKGKLSQRRKKHERQRWFKRLNRFRVAIEAKISLLKRRYGLRRCLYKGTRGFARWVYLGVIASNAVTIARQLIT